MNTTPELFEAFLKCPTKCWLRAAAVTASGNLYAEWVIAQNKSYRAIEISRLLADFPVDEVTMSPLTNSLKATRWRLATNQTLRLKTSSCPFESTIHAIERVPADETGKPTRIIPIRFIFTNKLGKADRLLIAFDALVLSRFLGREIAVGKIIHGDNHATVKVKTLALAAEVRQNLDKIAALLTISVPPDLILSPHCTECEFQTRCRLKAIETDDLSLLAGMTAKERQKLRSKGIFTVTQLSYTFRPRRRPKRMRDKREKYHHSLKALAIREKKPHIIGSPELKIEGTPVYFDVEGLPDQDFYYLIGLRICHGKSAIQYSMWAETAADEEKNWWEFLGILETVENPVLVHYGSYETMFLKQMADRYGGPQEDSIGAKAIDAAINLISVTYAQIYLPTYSNSLKEFAGYLGLNWSEPEATGLTSIVCRDEWERFKVPLKMKRLITYNSEDCLALQMLTETILRIINEAISQTDPASKNIVNCDNIKRKQRFRWSLEEFSVHDFATINQAAYWSYQRGRVYVKAPSLLGIPKQRKWRRLSFDRDVEVTCPPDVCRGCGQKEFRKTGFRTKVVHDLRFQRRGIVRRSLRLLANHYVCVKCGTKGPPIAGILPDDKYGHGLTAYIIYHLVDAFVPQEAVARILNRMFGFRLAGAGCINPIKAKAANFYRSTYESILQRLAQGQLLHVDETRVNLQGKSAYVWVFASLDHVGYIYTETREADLPKQFLADFRGVLVSDFYAAYDSIPCPQQKCLVHLLRDLNTDLLNSPFNFELRQIAEELGSLLRTILMTVDRFGLKTRFMRKHKVQTEKFLKKTISSEFQTRAAIKYQMRFAKYREKLFTFLRYDSVPWNNNNAEHAIKPLAQLRRVLKGNSTERGIRDYLVLLSICQTCKYMGVDFLEFLLSGEKDVQVFAMSRRNRRRYQTPTG